MVLAHFNKDELKQLDQIQGGKHVDPKTGIRHYKKLGEIFKDPKVQERSLSQARAYYASGGRAEMQKLKKHGRFGDTEVAYIPENLAHHLDKMIGGKCVNPKTGHREYFFGALLSGLSSIGRAAIDRKSVV